MNSIVINKIDQIIMVTNKKYKNVRHIGNVDPKCPDIGLEYIYLQWGDDVWFENYYVDNANHKFLLSSDQEVVVGKVCSDWEQDLGQEGNPTIDQAKEKAKIDLMVAFSSATNELSNRTTSHEMSSWSVQILEANAFIADSSASTPFIDVLLVSRNLNETKEELVGKIINNSIKYNAEYGKLLGAYQFNIKQIDNATSVDEIKNITFMVGKK